MTSGHGSPTPDTHMAEGLTRLLTLIGAIAAAVMVFAPGPAADRMYAHSSLIFPAVPLWLSYVAWRRTRRSAFAQAWSLVCIGLAGLFGYDIVWYVAWLIDAPALMPAADLLNMTFAPLVAVGLLRSDAPGPQDGDGRARLLDASLLTVALFTLVAGGVAMRGGALPPLRTVDDVLLRLAPIVDLFTLGCIAWLWVRRTTRPLPAWVPPIGAMLFLGLMVDVSYALPRGEVPASRLWIPATWYATWVLVAAGASRAIRGSMAASVASRVSRLPYILAVLCYAVFGIAMARGHRAASLIAAAGVGVITLLVLGRQWLALRALSRLQTERARSDADSRLAALVRHGSELLTIMESDLTFRYASPSHETIFGFPPARILGLKLDEIVHREDRDAVLGMKRRLLELGSPRESIMVRLKRPGADWRWIEATVTNLLAEPSICGLVSNSRDVTERRVLEQQLLAQALRDPLTGLGNRRLMVDRVQHALERVRRVPGSVAVLLLDLDHFKFINDTLGHAQGDALLVQVADRIRHVLRSSDTVARLGGDEFAVLLEDLPQMEEAENTASRLEQAFVHPFELGSREVVVRASIGIAWARPEQSVDDVITEADVAMYAAKNAGRGRVERFTSEMRARVAERHDMEADLRRAIEQAQFTLAYQPLVHLTTGAIVGVEALARWEHPERGEIAPSRFIAIAEETGQIVPFGRVVLGHALRDVARFRFSSRADAVSVAVNLSARQLMAPGLIAEISDLLAANDVPGNALIVELTESVLADNAEAIAERLHALRTLGIRIALDDFGTGYSALAYLRRFPIDSLKVDKSFVSWVREDVANEGVTRAILAMGHSLSLETVAEGIETREQLAWLRSLGCVLGQGFLFARPLPADECVDLLRSWDARAFAVEGRALDERLA